jgi:acetyl-CoA acetyltransferase
MSEAFVYDAIRTPRGKGKKDGSLHEVKPVNLLAGLLTELQRRNDFDTAQVDDMVMGIVSPVGEQGSVLPKVAALKAGWDFRCAGVQLNRFCASGLEAVNMAAQKVRSRLGRPGRGRRRGEHEPRADRLRRRRLGAWTRRPTAPRCSCRRASAPT